MPIDSNDSDERRSANSRRRFLKTLAVGSMTAPLVLGLAAAQGHDMGHGAGDDHGMGHDMGGGMAGHGGMQMSSSALPDIGPAVLPAIPIPWATGVCAFCGMTIVTPPEGANPAGFREKTYGQIRLAPGHEHHGEHTLHYESLACMFNHAYTQNIVDGHDATFYVANYLAAPSTEADLLLSRDATYLWAAGLNVSMGAHLAAFANSNAAQMFVAANSVGRHHYHSAAILADLAPIPEAGLLGLLNRHS